MIDPTIACPNCATEIRLTESLAGPMLAEVRRNHEAQLKSERERIADREAAVEAACAGMAAELEARLAAARDRLAEEATIEARNAAATDMARLQAVLEEREVKLASAQQAEAKFLQKSRALDDAKRELELTLERQVAAQVAAVRDAARVEIEAKLAASRRSLAEEAAAQAATAAAADMSALREQLQERDSKLVAAQTTQVEFLRKSRALDDAKRELELTIEQRVGAEVGAARDRARAEAEAGLRLKVAEKEATISGMQTQIEHLRRRAEQGSQQLQGEVLEIDMENRLRARFPQDVIEPVAKGVSGADVVQRVVGPGGEACGAILWESKRTRAWSDGWISKLKADQRAMGAEFALLISEALPKGVESFDHSDGVWVASPRCAIPLALALRQHLLGVSAARTTQAGQATKMELVYDYLTGPRFRHRVEAIIERFNEMSEDLDRERKAMTRLWAKREAQIGCVVDATVGMYGDLQGIAGKALAEIEGLALPLPDSAVPTPGRVVGAIPRRT